MILSRLEQSDATAPATQLTGCTTLSQDVLAQIVTQSDGVPLFIEELTKSVMESAAQDATDPLARGVPATLQASLMARLDRIPTAKQVAQIGAVIGREFSWTLLHDVADLPGSALSEGLEQVGAAGLVFKRGEGTAATYVLKHALVQDTAYDALVHG